ncbi:MAG TPA: ThuA domain-containing protein [Bryobacteraceae bacterium]|nr:ThuA domain-containing protein [Bryobacteraceae bacterium]
MTRRSAVLTLAGAAVTNPQQNAPAKLRVFIVTGGHDHEPDFYSLFSDPGWKCMTDAHPFALARDIRERFDVLVMHDMYNDLDEKGRRNLQAFVQQGRGVVVVHHALASHWQWEWWWKEVVGGRYLLKPDAGLPASTFAHDQQMTVTPVGEHAVLGGVGRMQLHDETYGGMQVLPDVTPLLRTDHPKSSPIVGWIGPCKTSRVIAIQPGHDSSTHRDPQYRRLIRNAVIWSSGRSVT